MSWRVITDDCTTAMRALDAASIDCIVTDPPYGLGFMGKEWDALPPGVEWATQCLRVLKPGGYLLAFGGSRTYHRLACAVEDAGLEIRDTIMWLYGSGFPKSRTLADGIGTALKPGHEPIVLARAPLEGSAQATHDKHGTAGLNIGACQISVRDGDYARNHSGDRGHSGTRAPHDVGATDFRQGGGSAAEGRWPTNVILDEDAAAELDAQTGELRSGANPTRRGSDKFRQVYGDFSGQADCVARRGADSGGASRFYYCAKPSTAERNAGLDGFPEGMPDNAVDRAEQRESGAGRGSRSTPRANIHPTVKPIDLMRWLIRLAAPPGGTVLDPFTGSGTTGIAAALEDRDFIGIEREPEYVAIAESRIRHWMPQGFQLTIDETAA